MNSVHLIGRLGRAPERRSTQTGKAVCTFSIATDEREQGPDGKWVTRPEWHRIVVWDRQAEACAAHLAKGSLVGVEGRIRTRKWTDRDGDQRQLTEIVAKHVEFLGGRLVAAPALGLLLQFRRALLHGGALLLGKAVGHCHSPGRIGALRFRACRARGPGASRFVTVRASAGEDPAGGRSFRRLEEGRELGR